MRFKAALIIIVIAFAITAVNFGSSLILTRQSLTQTTSDDISLARDIANDFVSTRISLYKSNAHTVAERLMKTDSPKAMEAVMREQLAEFTDFMAFTVFDRKRIVAEYGDSPTLIDWLEKSKYIRDAFNGRTVISTTRHDEPTGKLVMHICTPMGSDRVLSVTIPGLIFSELFDNYVLRDTGHIFMLDEEGTVIAHIFPELIEARTGYVDAASQATPQATEAFFINMLGSNEGLGTYTYDGEEYQCAYAKVKASEVGWRIGLSVPLSESPLAKVRKRLLVLAVIFFTVSAVTAIISSGHIAKPYYKVAEQNHRLEELNEITSLQTKRIQEAHQRTKLMMDTNPICSMLWDKNGNIFDCNEESVKTFGMKDKQDFLNKFFDLSAQYQSNGQPSQELAMYYIDKAFKEGKVSFEWMHKLLNGTLIPCEMTLVRVSYDGSYIVAAYARDLREHKRMMAETLRLQTELEAALKEAQGANRAKSSFLASMSHEMRTPLNAVVGLSELILNMGEVHGEVEDKLSKIYISGMTLLGIVNDILDISKIESGKFELHPVEYDTPSLVNDIVSLNIVRIGEKPIQFILKIDETFPGQLFGDDLRVKQIFNNFLSNAFKYTNAGTVQWTVSYERDGGDIWLVSDVSDTGIGLKQSDMPMLFQDYSQLDAQTNRKTEGTGLGLSITKRLVDMMDGSVTVHSEYGKGTTFSVRLRQRHVSDIPIGIEVAQNLMSIRFTATKRAQSANLKRIDLSYAHILVVDDMPTNLDVAKGMLIPYGIKVDCAASGQNAIAMIRSEKPRYDAVFMDHMMPGMDGIEATRIIREEIGTDYARNVPVIALTANAIIGNEGMFLEHGFQAFISKPIDMMRLDSVLRRWVRNKDLEKKSSMENEPREYDEYIPHAENDNTLPDGITIDGVDIAAGLERFGGDEETYISVLRSYAVNTRPLLGDIEKYITSGNFIDYGIAVHGINGASFGIGASEAGKEAEKLERLAKMGATVQVLTANGSFMENMGNLLDSIDAALAFFDSKREKLAAAKPNPVLLQELRNACGEYDPDKVDRAMSRLESFEYENGSELVAWLRNQVDDMSYNEIFDGNWPDFDAKTA